MFGIADYGAFVIAVLIFLAIPGPGNLALALSTAKGGFWAGMAATVGVILGDQTLLWLAVAGLAGVLAASPKVFALVQWAGAVYLVWLGAAMLKSTLGDSMAGKKGAPITIEPRRYAWQAYVITILNPKAIVFYMAFFTQFVDSAKHQGLLTFGLMAATIAGLTLAYGLLAVSIAYFAADTLDGFPKIGTWLTRLASLALIGFGLKLIF